MQEWDKQEGETQVAYEAFLLYLHMDGRSLAKVGKKRADAQGKSRVHLGQLESWSSANDWVRRSQAYDAHIHSEAQIKLEAEQVARKKELLEREKNLSDQLYERVQEMLKYPLTEREVTRKVEQDGVEFEQVVILKPAKWNYNSLRLTAEAASELGRKALELPTDTKRLEVTDAEGKPLGSTSIKEVLDNMSTAEIASEFQKRVRGELN